MSEKHQCSEKVWNKWSHVQCSRNGPYFECDRWWCGWHAPSAVKARREAQEGKWRAGAARAAEQRAAQHRAAADAELKLLEEAWEQGHRSVPEATFRESRVCLHWLERWEREQAKESDDA